MNRERDPLPSGAPAAPGGLLLVGNPGGTNVGASLARAADALGLACGFLDATRAYQAPRWIARAHWWLLGRRPARLRPFGRQAVTLCQAARPARLLTTGLAPLDASALDAIGREGARRLNFLTDDPWNPALRASWFLDALPRYDAVFTPRRANVDDLRRLGCPRVHYLPFAYDPDLWLNARPATADAPEQAPEPADRPDVMFAGGADRDRVPILASLIRQGFRVALYGDYWDRFPETRSAARGHVGPGELLRATRATRVALCLVRRANRDGHVMRSFEIPAAGACMLAEDTPEHRDLFGPDALRVVYFRSPADLVDRLHDLLRHDDERARLAAAGHAHIVAGRNTYRDRLEAMLAADA